MGRLLGLLCLAFLFAACAPLYGGKPEGLKTPSRKKRPDHVDEDLVSRPDEVGRIARGAGLGEVDQGVGHLGGRDRPDACPGEDVW